MGKIKKKKNQNFSAKKKELKKSMIGWTQKMRMMKRLKKSPHHSRKKG